MLTDLQRRKLTRMFRYIDGDHDDVLVAEDYTRICNSLLRALEAPTDSSEVQELRASYVVEWDELVAAAKTPDRSVTLEGWLAYREEQLSGPDAWEVMLLPYISTVFAHLDRDHDDRLTVAEVRRYLSLYGMEPRTLDGILERINPQGRAQFSREDIHQLVKEYYFSDDPAAPGSSLLGY